MYTNLLHLPLLNFAYVFILSFLAFLSTYLLVLFLLLYSSIGTSLEFCFPVCALDSFVLVDIIFGFLCSLGQSIVLYFCWTVLILLMGDHVYVYIKSHFLLLFKPLPPCWASAVLWSFPYFFFLSSSAFLSSFLFLTLILNFLKPIIFFIHLFFCLSFLLFFSPCN